MAKKKSGRTAMGDIPVVFPCPQCGKEIQEDLRGFDYKREFICRLGGHTFWLTEEQRIEIFRKHSARVGKIFGR